MDKENKEINVFFPYYQSGDEARQREIDFCLKQNIDNKAISKLFILIDDESELPYDAGKIEVISLNSRPTYRKWLELSQPLEGISLLANSDIYFDETLTLVKQVLSTRNNFLALSRWELIGNQTTLHPNPHWSQDVWGINCQDEFSEEMLKSLEFPMGVPRCDNKVSYIFAVRGWAVKNPCAYLKSIHVHETQMRTYHKKLDTRILGGVAYVHPGETALCNAELELDVWSVNTSNFKSVSINKSMEKWIKEDREQNQTSGSESQNNKQTEQENNFVLSSSSQALNAIKHGEKVFAERYKFEAYHYDGNYFFKNVFNVKNIIKTEDTDSLRNYLAPAIIPPVISTHVAQITDKAKNQQDVDFWQYPCATEKQAYENHLSLKHGEHVNMNKKVISTFLPVPWATYVDRKDFTSSYLTKLAAIVNDYKTLAHAHGFTLKIHTVCQHIHWRRILPSAKALGVTDLHLSHKYSKSDAVQKEEGFDFTLHGWPLIAVNYVTPERSEGMERKPMCERKLLASFIGAHMPHYRDQSRIQLFEAAKACGREDVFVDLGNEWHFNKVVYEEQVLNKEVESHHIDEHHQRTFRYNSILSDSKFSLCPEGAGPNTLRFWESIAIGSIPVLFSDDLAILAECPHGKVILDNSIVWTRSITDELFELLSSIDIKKLNEMQSNLMTHYEKIESSLATSKEVF